MPVHIDPLCHLGGEQIPSMCMSLLLDLLMSPLMYLLRSVLRAPLSCTIVYSLVSPNWSPFMSLLSN